jgi:hypothetical protein
LYPLYITEDNKVRKSGFAADRATSDNEGASDGEDEDDESMEAGHVNDESGEEEEDETLEHLSKSSLSTSLKDWSEDDDKITDPCAVLNARALHIAVAAVAQGRSMPIVDLSDSPEP